MNGFQTVSVSLRVNKPSVASVLCVQTQKSVNTTGKGLFIEISCVSECEDTAQITSLLNQNVFEV